MGRPIITVDNLSKAYRIGAKEEVPDTIVGAVGSCLRAPVRNLRRLRRLDASSNGSGHTPVGDPNESDLVWALRDVSFEVHEGEVLGIIGRNGAGKSTLLKILSRITEPTSGRAALRGRVSSLLEVGTGFHPELTGRENIYMNGTILGMTKREIDRKFDEIVDFSGVEKFLDTPIKRYSSGMQVRLAFAVAAHLEPEILVVDEVLAVGDAEFQRKCVGKMQDVARTGRTVLFVSHSMAAIETLCSRAIVISDGRVSCDESVAKATQHYRSKLSQAWKSTCQKLKPGNGRSTVFRSAAVLDQEGNETSFVTAGEQLHLRIKVHAATRINQPVFGLGIDDAIGQRILSLHTPAQNSPFPAICGDATMDCVVPWLPLAPGEYTVKLSLALNWQEVDWVDRALHFSVTDGNLFGQGRGAHRGYCVAPVHWAMGEV